MKRLLQYITENPESEREWQNFHKCKSKEEVLELASQYEMNEALFDAIAYEAWNISIDENDLTFVDGMSSYPFLDTFEEFEDLSIDFIFDYFYDAAIEVNDEEDE